MLSKTQLEQFRKAALAKGYTESEINSLISRKMQEEQVANAARQVQTQQPVAQSKNFSSKVGDFFVNTAKGAVKPLVDYGKFVGEAGAQGYRALTDPLMKKATFNPGQMTEEDWIALGKLKESFLVDPSEIKDRGEIALTGSKKTAGAMAYAVPGGQATTGGRIASAGVSGLLSGYGSSEKGQELSSTIGGGATGLATGLFFEGLRGVNQRLKQKRVNTKREVNLTKQIKNDPFFLKNEKELQQLADDLGVNVKGLSPRKKMEIIQEAFENRQTQINQTLQGQNLSNISTDQGNAVDTLYDSLIDRLNQTDYTPGNKTYENKVNLQLQKLANVGDDPVALNQYKSELRGQLANAFKKIDKGTALTKDEEIRMAAYQAIKDTLDTVSPDIRALNAEQAGIYRLADEFGGLIQKDKPVKLGALGVGIDLPVTREQTARRTSQLWDILGAGPKGIMNLAGKTGQVLQGVEGATPTMATMAQYGPVVRNALLSKILGSGGQQEQAPQQPGQQPINQQIPGMENQPLPQGAGLQKDTGVQGLASVLTPEVLAMALLKGDISSSDISALQALGILQAPEGDKSATDMAADQTQQLAQQAYQMLQSGDIKTGMIGGPLQQTLAKFGSGQQETLDFNTMIGNIRGAIVKARAGTAFTANEEKLINTYVPNVGDSKQELETKLRLLQTDAGKAAIEQLMTPRTIEDVQAQLNQ